MVEQNSAEVRQIPRPTIRTFVGFGIGLALGIWFIDLTNARATALVAVLALVILAVLSSGGLRQRLRWSGYALIAFAVFASGTPISAHTPDDVSYNWSCLGGANGADGICWAHHSFANADWHIEPDPGGPPNNFPPTTFINRAQSAAARWNTAIQGHAFTFNEVNDASSADVWWRPVNPCGDPNNLGCMYSFVLSSNSHLVESVSYILIDNRYDWYMGTGSPPPDEYDLFSTLVHEFGHYAGLGHSARALASMWPTSDLGDTHQRTPNHQDRDGLCDIYDHAHGYQAPGC